MRERILTLAGCKEMGGLGARGGRIKVAFNKEIRATHTHTAFLSFSFYIPDAPAASQITFHFLLSSIK